jgi:MFS family permease
MIKQIKALTQSKKFLNLWESQFFSQVAVQTLNFLIIVRVFEITGSSIASSFVWLIFITPAIVIGPFASAAVDIMNKKNTLVVSNLVQTLIILLYALTFEKFFYLSYGAVFLYSVVNQFYIPAESASLPLLVKEKNLAQANSLFLISYQLAMIIGFGLSSIVREFLGFRGALLLSSALVFGAYLAARKLPNMETQKRKLQNLEQEVESFFVNIAEGYNFIKNNSNILISFLMISALQVSLAVVTVNLPTLTSELIGIKPHFSGLFAIPAGLGATAGIYAVSRLLNRDVEKKKIVKFSLTLMAVVIWILMIVPPFLPLYLRIVVSLVFIFIIGMAFIGVFIPSQTILQTQTPKPLLGRVMGNSWFITTIATSVPLIFSATISELFGSRVLFSILGVLIIGILLLYNHYAINSHEKISTNYRA